MDQLFILTLRLFALLPLAIAQCIGGFIGWAMAYLPNKKRHISQRNVELCLPDLPADKQTALVRRSLIETGKTAAETGALLSWKRDRLLGLVKDCKGEAELRAAHQRGKGVIIAAPHLGAWELVGLYCSARYPMTSLYRPQKGRLDNFIRCGRERLGAHLVPTNLKGVRPLYEALNRGELIGILPDQNPGKGVGVFAPFFGVDANTMVLLSRLAQKSGATVMFAYAERLAPGQGFRMHFIPANKGLYDSDITQSVTAMNRGLEDQIRRFPHQYWWSYPRFRRNRSGRSNIYQ